jgi:hypothetical protein
LFTGCKGCSEQQTHTVTKKTIDTYEMSDGSRAYRGTDGFWYWYLLYTVTSSGNTTYISSTPVSSPTWSRQSFAPSSYPKSGATVEKEEQLTEPELEADTKSSALPEEPVEQVEEYQELGPAEPENVEPATVEPSSSPSEPSEPAASEPASEPDSSSSSSDSGGGGSDD